MSGPLISQLSDGNIVISSKNASYAIIIFDASSFIFKKEIHVIEYINSNSSSLCVFNEHLFICADNNIFLKISSKDYSMLTNFKKVILMGIKVLF